MHLQQIFAFPSGAPGEMDRLTPFEMAGLGNLERFQKYNGYAEIQSKRPATLGYGLVDSPVAQLAWNAELFFGFEGEAVRTRPLGTWVSGAYVWEAMDTWMPGGVLSSVKARPASAMLPATSQACACRR